MAWRRNPASPVVVREVVLGSRNAEIPATQTLIIRGSRGFRPARVSCRHCKSDSLVVIVSAPFPSYYLILACPQ